MNGKLYFNKGTRQVERIVEVQGKNLIWTSRHKHEAKAYPKSNFRKATKEEVENYLKEAEVIKV